MMKGERYLRESFPGTLLIHRQASEDAQGKNALPLHSSTSQMVRIHLIQHCQQTH